MWEAVSVCFSGLSKLSRRGGWFTDGDIYIAEGLGEAISLRQAPHYAPELKAAMWELELVSSKVPFTY